MSQVQVRTWILKSFHQISAKHDPQNQPRTGIFCAVLFRQKSGNPNWVALSGNMDIQPCGPYPGFILPHTQIRKSQPTDVREGLTQNLLEENGQLSRPSVARIGNPPPKKGSKRALLEDLAKNTLTFGSIMVRLHRFYRAIPMKPGRTDLPATLIRAPKSGKPRHAVDDAIAMPQMNKLDGFTPASCGNQ